MPTPIQTASALRQTMTGEEKLLWQNLKARKFHVYKFRRQHPLAYQKHKDSTGFYIADFYCNEKKLIIELDGKMHEFKDQKEYDVARDKLMNEFGIRTLRIKNEELKNITAVRTKIFAALRNDLPPSPLAERVDSRSES